MTGRFKQALLEMKKSKKGRKGKMPKNFSVGSGDKSKAGGLTKKGVKRYRAANPGSKLKTAVTTKPSKLKKGSKAANRRKSFCKRMGGMKKKLTSKKTSRDPDSRINKALRKWNCSTDANPNALQQMVENFYIDLAVEEFVELYENQGNDIENLHGDFLSESCSYWLDNVSQVREAFGNYVHPSRKGAATKPQDDPLQRMARGRVAGRAPKAQVPMRPKDASNFMGDTMKRGVSKKPIPKATPSRFGALGDIAKGFAGRYADPARDAFDGVKSFMSDPKQRQKAIDAGKSRLKSFFNPKEIGRSLGGAARDVGRKIGGGVRSRLRGAGDRFKKFLNRRIIPDTQSKFESLSDYELDSLVEKFITSTEIVRNARQGLAEMILNRIQENDENDEKFKDALNKLRKDLPRANKKPEPPKPKHTKRDSLELAGTVTPNHPDYVKKKLYNRPTKKKRMAGDTDADATEREPITRINKRGLTNKSDARQARTKKKFAKLDKVPTPPEKTKKGSYADQEWEPSMSRDTTWGDDDED